MKLLKKKIELDYKIFPSGEIMYYVNVYSGEKELTLIVDSGASMTCIFKTSLKGCNYESIPLGASKINGVNGESKVGKADFTFGFTPENNKSYSNCITVLYKKYTSMALDCDGILGADFLKFFTIDFSNAYLYENGTSKGRVIETFRKLLSSNNDEE